MRSVTLLLSLLLPSLGNADESARSILQGARDAVANMPALATKDVPRLAFTAAQGSSIPRDPDGWPLLQDVSGVAIPYDHHPRTLLDPNIDVNALNRRLEQSGAGAAIYQLAPERAYGTVPLSQHYALIFKNGQFSAVPFDNRLPWSRIVAIDTIGSILVTENEHSVLYIDLSAGISAEGYLGQVGSFEKSARWALVSVKGSAKPGVSATVLGSILLKAGFVSAERGRIRSRIASLSAGSATPYELNGDVDVKKPDVSRLVLTVDGKHIPLAGVR